MSVRGRKDRVAENGAPKRMRRSVEAKAVDYLEIVLDDQNDTQVTVTETTEHTVTQSPPPIKESSPPAPEISTMAPGVPIAESTQSTWPTWRNRYFVDWRENAGGQVFARCRLCNTNYYFAGAWSSFSNFSKHLVGVHSIQWRSDSAGRKCGARTESTSPAPTTDLNADLARAICLDNLPIHLLDKPNFRQWIQKGMAGYSVPSGQSMRTHFIPQLYDQCKGAVEGKLTSCTTFSLMIDVWPTERMMGLITFTCSAITKDFERFRCFLSVRKSSGRINEQVVLSLYEQVVGQWNIPRQAIVRIMTDCGQNALSTFLKMKLPGWEDADPAGIRAEGFRHPWETLQDVALRLIETHLEHQLQPADATHSAPTSAIHAPCLVHQLQLVVSDGLAAIQGSMVDAIGHASRIINFIRRNEPDRQTMKTSADWQPVGDVVNWNDQYRTLRQLIDAFNGQPELQGRLHATRKLHALTAAELRLLKQFLLVLEPFEEACHDFQQESESIGNVIPAYLDMLTKVTLRIQPPCGQQASNPLCPLADLAQALRTSLVRRLSHVLDDGHYVLGAVLDPRFKKNWIKYSGRAESDVLAGVRSQLEVRYRALCQRGEVADDRPEVKECVGTPPTKRSANRSLYSTFLEAVPVASGARMKILTEFETFINEPVSPWEEAADATSASTDPEPLYPLKFWKSNAARLPLLSLVARDVFGIPASSGSIRRLLSAATDIQDAVRNRTDADLFDRMMFVKHNMHLFRQS